MILGDLVTTPHSRVRVEKGWGWEDWIYNGDYCGKRLFFHASLRCSFHYHVVKDEVLYVHSGRLRLRFGETDDYAAASEVILGEGMAFRVHPGLRHQMIALTDTLIYEFSTHHEDADSICVVKGD